MKPINVGRTILLCVIGGSADAIAYLRYDTFVGAMSGNTVLLGIGIVRQQYGDVLYHAAITAIFLIAIIFARAVLVAGVAVVVPLILTAIMLGGTELILGRWAVALAAAALGMQTAAVQRIGGVPVNTVFITGDLLRLGSAVPEAEQPRQGHRLAVLVTAWIAYAAGAAIGTATLHLVRHPMIVPAAVAFVAALVETYAKRVSRVR